MSGPGGADEVAARLYALPPEEFTAARNEAVASARAAGDRDLARTIGAFRRPTVGGWLVNLLAHQRPDLMAELFALGGALRTAQRNLRGDELRELSVRRRTTIAALAREARALAIAAGRGVRDALPMAEVENTLGAALADDEVAEQVRSGRLVKTTEYAGFGEAPRPQLRLVHGGSERAEAAERAEAVRRAREREAAERVAVADRRRRQQKAHRELLAARTALAEAEAQRTLAERAVRDARRRVEAAHAATEKLKALDP